MKKINLSVMAVLLGTALAFAGSKGISLPKYQSVQWFQLDPGGDPSDPNHYKVAQVKPNNCLEPEERCAIYAEEDMANPGKPTKTGVQHPIEELLRASTR